MNNILKYYPSMILGILFLPIVSYEASLHIESTKGTTINQDWINVVRVINFLYIIYCIIFALYIEKLSINKLNNKFSFKGISPRIISYIIGIGFILSLSIYPLILQNFRLATTIDVMIYSILSIAGILIWSWRYRDIFINNNDTLIIGTEDQSLQNDEHKVAKTRQYMSKYTNVLTILGTLSLIILSLKVASYFNLQENGDIDSNFNILLFSLYIVLTVGCLTVVFLRKKKSIYTVFATRTISCFLIFWVPLGTATFIYWVWKVRKREEAE